MARRRITKETMERLLQGFREAPGNFLSAAKFAGVTAPTARKYWLNGVSSSREEYWNRPFCEIIEQEQVEARARMELEQREAAAIALRNEAERQTQVKARAAKDATDERVQEASMVRMARQGAMVLLNTITQVSAGASSLGKKVAESLKEIGEDPDQKLTLNQSLAVTQTLNRLTTALRQASDAAQKAMEMERLLLGEPGKIVGHLHAVLEPVSVVEAREKLESVQRSLDTLEAEGIEVMDDRPHDPSLQ